MITNHLLKKTQRNNKKQLQTGNFAHGQTDGNDAFLTIALP